ncbi:unnamed protein product [Cyclocybe aegerita]|uniref:Glutamyl-tRNA synthetase n=1 Tax=Cyclocybe aegerita TaxID=1973307 RepID=A0A8S0WV43_CYCAE|nr:unnamed protein product [Cyclocybe aegerita]
MFVGCPIHFDQDRGEKALMGHIFKLDLYKSYAGKLLDSGNAYRCFCSQDTLAEIKGKLARSGSSASYDRRCLHLTEEEAARKVRAGEKYVVRFNNTAAPTRPPATDLIFGRPRDTHASLATDPIILKTDQFPTYHLASVADDHEMGITHVLRGEEWLPSLPLHLDLYASLKIPAPHFGHMPILLNPDGSKMSKRHGDVQVMDFIKRGWEPEGVLNWLVLSGWGVSHEAPSPDGSTQARSLNIVPDSTRIMTMDEMVDQFDLSAITHRNTVLEAAKLEYINKHHVMRRASTRTGLEELAQKVHEHIKEAFPNSPHTTLDMIKKAISILEGRLTNIYDIPFHAPYLFQEPDLTSAIAKAMREKIASENYDLVIKTVKATLEGQSEDWDDIDFLTLLHKEREVLELSTRAFMTPLRYALTGMKDGPAIADIMDALGRERTLARLR